MPTIAVAGIIIAVIVLLVCIMVIAPIAWVIFGKISKEQRDHK